MAWTQPERLLTHEHERDLHLLHLA
ncbi:MAG: hypothetical protein JWP87_4171, partial [Labilithrix sp.]|nr:hypothetical protein [Labilithrix sp.]